MLFHHTNALEDVVASLRIDHIHRGSLLNVARMKIFEFLSKAPPELTALISFLPIGLYAESMRVNSALVRSISCSSALPRPLTGCVKDLDRLWHITKSKVFEHDQAIVASRRHGNNFSLANCSLLQECGVVGRTCEESDIPLPVHRLTALHITFVMPGQRSKDCSRQTGCYLIFVGEVVLLGVACFLQFANGLYIGGALMICMMVNLAIQMALQYFARVIFANEHSLAQDKAKTTLHGAATDVHVIARTFNATDIDVLVGYSSQLHALSNIAIRVPHWKAIRWIIRGLATVLAIQAALLATVFGKSNNQAFGSMIWLFFYFLLQFPPKFQSRYHPEDSLHGQPARLHQVPPLLFSARRPALAFIGAIPMTDGSVGKWEWLDGFMPPNERRRQWERELEASKIASPPNDAELGPSIEKRTEALVEEVKNMQKFPGYANALHKYVAETRVLDRIGQGT